MAGKTLLGIGNGARDGGRARGDLPGGQAGGLGSREDAAGAPTSLAALSSEPTVVDDEKVREGLRRLRSLDSSSQSRPSVDPLAATVARALEPVASEPAAARNGVVSLARTTTPAAAAARSLDSLVPLPEGGSGPHTTGNALIKRPDQVLDRGTLVGRDLHLPPEFGGKGRERSRTPTPRTVPQKPPRLPAGVKPPIPRTSRPPTGKRRIDDTYQLRSRPNLAARIVIVLTTAAAVALLGVAGIRWHQDGEISSRPRAPAREWPSSETLPVHPAAPAAESKAALGHEAASPARASALPTLPPAAPAPASGSSSGLHGPGPRPSGLLGAEAGGTDQGNREAATPSLSEARSDSSRHHRRRDRSADDATTSVAPPASSTGAPSSSIPAPLPANAPPSITPPPLSAPSSSGREGKPAKGRGGKDDPDSTLPLDLD